MNGNQQSGNRLPGGTPSKTDALNRACHAKNQHCTPQPRPETRRCSIRRMCPLTPDRKAYQRCDTGQNISKCYRRCALESAGLRLWLRRLDSDRLSVDETESELVAVFFATIAALLHARDDVND